MENLEGRNVSLKKVITFEFLFNVRLPRSTVLAGEMFNVAMDGQSMFLETIGRLECQLALDAGEWSDTGVVHQVAFFKK